MQLQFLETSLNLFGASKECSQQSVSNYTNNNTKSYYY